MLNGLISFFKKRTPENHENAVAWVKLLVKLCSHVETLEQRINVLAYEVRAERMSGERAAVDSYRVCMDRMAEFALGMSGQPELAARFRAQSGATERYTNSEQFSTELVNGKPDPGLDPLQTSDDEIWPPKDCVVMDSRG